jgi:hypothetical protein
VSQHTGKKPSQAPWVAAAPVQDTYIQSISKAAKSLAGCGAGPLTFALASDGGVVVAAVHTAGRSVAGGLARGLQAAHTADERVMHGLSASEGCVAASMGD